MSHSLKIPGDDQEVAAAIQEAQRRLPEFRRIIEDDSRRLIPAYGGSLAKIHFESRVSGAHEHIWLEGVYFEGSEVGGWVLTIPSDIPEIGKKSEIRVSTAKITDWVYYEGDTMHGGFVERILRRRAGHNE